MTNDERAQIRAEARIPIGAIRNTTLRRIALMIVFPALIVWKCNWRLLVFPFALAWDALEAGARAFAGSIYDNLHCRPIRLLVAGWKMLWARDHLKGVE